MIVIGDVMLDKTITTTTHRLSQEAPIPIFEIGDEKYSIGGAANLAKHLAKWFDVSLIGVVGPDVEGTIVREYIQRVGIKSLLVGSNQPTTVKTRVKCGQQVFRMDKENSSLFKFETYEKIKQHLTEDVIVISDYDKGVITPGIIEVIKEKATKIFVDPKKRNLKYYNDVDFLKVNDVEFGWLRELYGDSMSKEIAINMNTTLVKTGFPIFVQDAEKIITYLPEEVSINTVGAGDVFFAAFIKAIQEKKLYKEAMEEGHEYVVKELGCL